MKTTIITTALVLSTALLSAQAEKKQAKVHIKKIENINGVEKITDTTYTTDDASAINMGGQHVEVIETNEGKQGMTKKIIINGKDVSSEGADIKMLDEAGSDEEIRKALKDAGVNPDAPNTQQVVIVHNDTDNKNNTNETKIVIIKKIKITDADGADLRKINQEAGKTDGKLAVDNMNFYPNPGNGKFNLSFNLADKGDAEITILNMEGKKVYSEKLLDFTGPYDKEIDISKNPKGVYFVRIEQGKHAQAKKVVLD